MTENQHERLVKSLGSGDRFTRERVADALALAFRFDRERRELEHATRADRRVAQHDVSYDDVVCDATSASSAT
jgi:hypothetical protein